MAPPKPEPPDDNSDPSSTLESTKPNYAANNKPRRASDVKRTPNGSADKPENAATPMRKQSAQNKSKTPNTAPARVKTGRKKAEPTLLGDFLLGRPSPARTRRKSLDVVKAEMRKTAVKKVPPPGGVGDRVKTWQRSNAAAIVIDPLADAASQPDDIGGWENEGDGSVDEEERLRIKFREERKTTTRRKSREPPETPKHIANAAPLKRVISDSHWMKQKKKSPPSSGAAIPKNFLQATALNPPLEKKISDWVKRTENEDSEVDKPNDKLRSRKASKSEILGGEGKIRSCRTASPGDGIRIRPSPSASHDDGIRIKPGESSPLDGEIRVTPSKRRAQAKEYHEGEKDEGSQTSILRSPSKGRQSDKSKGNDIRLTPKAGIPPDDGIRIKALGDRPVDGIRVKPIRKMRSQKHHQEEGDNESQVSRKTSGLHLRIQSESVNRRKTSSHSLKEKNQAADDNFSLVSPSPPENSRRRKPKTQTPPESLIDIPFGSSAFSVIDLPLGAEAGNTIKRPPPKRNQSFAGVPKVFKKVFNEGMKMAHDKIEPPRGGQNHPQSIESWLTGTSDPFVDKLSPSASLLGVPEPSSACSRKSSYSKDDRNEKEFTVDHASKAPEQNRESRNTPEPQKEDESAIDYHTNRENLPSMTASSPPVLSGGLKRSPATRNAPQKAAKKLPLKEAFMDAFRGESSTSRTRSASNPFVDITGLRERDINTSPRPVDRRISRDFGDEPLEETPRRRSPRSSEKPTFEELEKEKPLPPYFKRTAPTTGAHRLSTIAASDIIYSTSSSTTGTDVASELSQTTITQDTVLTGPTTSSLSRNSHSNRSNKSGLKRRLTKHSDLVSMLSLPDVVQPTRKVSIKSARSIRTRRNHLDTATVGDLMRELAEDEAKYKRELKTLVDGVIPVLLTCVLSKSDSAIAAGLFNPNHDPSEDNAITKPIVDMGVALERLKNLHKRIPLSDADAFISWAQTAHRIYQDYLSAWRAGFQDVVVNLEPGSSEEHTAMDDIARDKNGDAVAANGERADVAYFLKRPLVRVKYLCRTVKGLSKHNPTMKSKEVEEQYQELAHTARRRHKEETARLEDDNAKSTDPTRARDPRTLDLVEGVKIDRSGQVCARDIFYLDLQHSTGQRVDCRVELILRDKPDDVGDVLICEVDDQRRFLLFPPVDKDMISARLSDTKDQIIIMIRGYSTGEEWHELLMLEAEDPEAAGEWVQLLGSAPLPPQPVNITDNTKKLDALVTSIPGWHDKREHLMSGGLGTADFQVPIGERVRQGAEEKANSLKQDRRQVSQSRSPARSGSLLPSTIKEESTINEPIKDLNDALSKAGTLVTPKRPQAARYHNRPTTPKENVPRTPSEQPTPTQSRENMKNGPRNETKDMDRFGPRELTHVAKKRSSSTPTSHESENANNPLKESIRPEYASAPTTPVQEDGPPPPPPHRTSKPPKGVHNVPALDRTPRAGNRRTSSPLKHEYQPSDASGTSSAEESNSYSSDAYSESSDDDELESIREVDPVPVYDKRGHPAGTIHGLPKRGYAHSNSATQGSYRSASLQNDATNPGRHTVMSLSYWNEKGQWIDIYTGPCSAVVGPGWLRIFKMDASHASPYYDANYQSSSGADGDAGAPIPLIAQELTPNVSMQRHIIDIHVRSPPLAESSLKCKGSTVRYHMLTPIACIQYYQALYEASRNNMAYNKLEEERRLNAYGTYGAVVPSAQRKSWFNHKRSYRVSARAPSEMVSEQSAKSSQSRLSALKSRLTGDSIFNIAKSSIDVSQGGHRSGSTSLGSSDYSGITPPRTPISMFSGSGTAQMVDLGSENIKIRLYQLASRVGWEDNRYAFLTVTPPPPGRRPNSTLHHGVEKHIIVTRREHNHEDGPGEFIIDEVVGATCFQMIGIKGVMVTIWDDIRGDGGEVGMIGARGGVSGRHRKYLFQTSYVAHANWIFNLCAAGRQ